jgi:transcriptional regulator of acetoin/glycerol metabolism
MGPVLGAELLPEAMREHAKDYGARAVTPVDLEALATTPTAKELRERLTQHGGNVSAVARSFRKDRVQVHRWMRRHGMTPRDFR